MKKGDIVKFKREVDPGDTELRMVLIDDPGKGRVMVRTLLQGWAIQPTSVYPVEELEIVLDADRWVDHPLVHSLLSDQQF